MAQVLTLLRPWSEFEAPRSQKGGRQAQATQASGLSIGILSFFSTTMARWNYRAQRHAQPSQTTIVQAAATAAAATTAL